MSTTGWIVIIVVIVVAVAVLTALLLRLQQANRRREHLQGRFGPEYDRTVAASDDRREAERVLGDREQQREQLDIRPLSPGARDRYAHEWHEVQAQFVDRPDGAVARADDLVQEVMRERGYPVDDFETRSDLVSVDYPGIVEDYRSAHGISERAARRQASTEDLRAAMLRYRSLFDALLETESRPS